MSLRRCSLLVWVLAALCAGCLRVNVHGDPAAAAKDLVGVAERAAQATMPLRVATYNASLYDDADDGLIRRLQAGDDGARKVAEVLQRVRPDLVLLNEFDYDPEGRAADLFQREYLEKAQAADTLPLRYRYRYFTEVNTGVPSGLDLDGNGKVGGEGRERGNDAWGYGLHPGQYGMLVLSRYPIDTARARTFRLLKWSAMPDAARPIDPRARGYYYRDPVWSQLRLSSKSHWDVAVDTPQGVVHFLVAHPTPPVFDGPEDRNGARNADELRLWREYLDDDSADRAWLCDDAGRCGGLPAGERFVIAGDLNNDPNDGDGRHQAIVDLLEHPRVSRHPAPRSEGAPRAASASGGANAAHHGPHAEDTGDFGPKVGNLRLDYVLPSANLRTVDSGVYWPSPESPNAALASASDHHLVWVDLLRGD
ncbi:MAG: endonuclease/exonuclease/phosphatase family protein [Lysobacteraceae bacterium]|nr:MAG: endonuclease/exonuclease/phosphatase family protein [Xanthomonadaceae bacterium]